MTDLREERVFWKEKYFGETWDFRSKILFLRFDGCTFVDCTLLIDSAIEQLEFTRCTFKDCNLTDLGEDSARALVARENFFDRPLKIRKAEFDRRLEEALVARKTSGGRGR